MGVEIGGADIAQVPVKDGMEAAQTFESKEINGKLNKDLGVERNDEPIKFGSHGTDVPVNGVEETAANSVFPKNAADEWPEPKQVHYFYFIRVRPFEDPKLKVKIEQAEKELQKKNQAFFQLTDAIKAKRSERAQIISQLKPLTTEDKQYGSAIKDRTKEMKPLNQALGKLRTTSSNRERGVVICSSEEELNDYIHSLNYRIQHESNTLVEEKQIIREIKQLEATRERVIANAAEKAKIQESMGEKEAIQDQVKLLGLDLDGMRKDQQTNRAKINHLEEELRIVDKEIALLQEKVDVMKENKEKAYGVLAELRKQRDDGNAYYYQNRSLLNNAKELAAKKDIAAVKELCHTEVEKFMSVWSSTKSFRADYEKRMLVSLDQRQMSRDGRLRNPNEKLLVEAPVATAEPEVVAKPNIKRPKEDPRLATQQETLSSRKVLKEDSNKLPEPETIKKTEDTDNLYTVEKAQEAPAIDPAKLKEMKREEEIAKAKLALERKKKMAEKAAAKAALRAQKEAEKKLKDREKKAKKKAGGPSSSALSSEEQTEPEEEVAEPEKPDVIMETPLVSKPKERKESTLRYYRRRGKGADSLPKAILKRRKSTPYWVWAAPAAVLFVMLLALGYYYYLL